MKVGTSLVSAVGLRLHDLCQQDGCVSVGISLVGTVGLRLLKAVDGGESLVGPCRNFPDQHGGIATVPGTCGSPRRPVLYVGTSLISTVGLRRSVAGEELEVDRLCRPFPDQCDEASVVPSESPEGAKAYSPGSERSGDPGSRDSNAPQAP